MIVKNKKTFQMCEKFDYLETEMLHVFFNEFVVSNISD